MTNRKPDGYTTAGEAARVREGKTGVVQGEPVRDPAVAVYFDEPLSAPIVPAPAYGVKALHWSNGFASTSFGSYDVCEEDDGWHFAVTDYPHRVMDDRSFNYEHEAKAAAQADFERRILSCLSSAPVEEADAKAGEPIAQTATNDQIAAVLLQTPTRTLEQDAQLRQYLAGAASTIPSEPEAKGEAGAGPVGEAVAWRVKDFADGWFVTDKDKLVAEAKEQGHAIEPLYARPVEEPGEVERTAAYYHESWLHEAARADAAEAALAETRERLEKELSILEQERVATLAALRLAAERLHEEGAPPAYVDDARSVLLGFTPEGCRALRPETTPEQVAALFEELSKGPVQGGKNAQIAYAKCAKIVRSKLARTALSTQESSAALAGDGKEAGK